MVEGQAQQRAAGIIDNQRDPEPLADGREFGDRFAEILGSGGLDQAYFDPLMA